MSILYDRVIQLCAAHNDEPRKLEQLCKLSKNAIDKRKKDTATAYIASVQKIANYYDVSVDYLIGNCDNPLSHKTQSDLEKQNKALKAAVKNFDVATEELKDLLTFHILDKSPEISIELNSIDCKNQEDKGL